MTRWLPVAAVVVAVLAVLVLAGFVASARSHEGGVATALAAIDSAITAHKQLDQEATDALSGQRLNFDAVANAELAFVIALKTISNADATTLWHEKRAHLDQAKMSMALRSTSARYFPTAIEEVTQPASQADKAALLLAMTRAASDADDRREVIALAEKIVSTSKDQKLIAAASHARIAARHASALEHARQALFDVKLGAALDARRADLVRERDDANRLKDVLLVVLIGAVLLLLAS